MKRLMIFLIFLLLCGARLGAQTCQLGTIQYASFMTYSGAMLTTTGSIGVTCPNNVAYSIELGPGYSGSVTNREMYCGNCSPLTLGYQLYSNSSYTVPWGNATPNIVSATGTGSNQTFLVYALIPANEAYFSGSNGSNYNDSSVLVTIVCGTCTSISANNQFIHVTLQQTAVGCGISASDLNFGNYTGTVTNATTTLQVGCSSGTPYNVGLDQGAHGGSVTTRKMAGPGGALLGYSLSQNSGHTTNWGNTVGTDTVAGTGTGAAQPLTVYGQLPAAKNVTPGNYTDTITATVTY